VNIVFVEPFFPWTQRQFVRALKAVGAYVMVVSEYAFDHYDDELKSWIDWHYRIDSVTDEAALEWAVRQAQRHRWVDRLECSIEAHVLPVARVRERCGIPGTSARAAFLCRDKPTMKEVLRAAGIPTAASAAVGSRHEALAFADSVGYPLIIKPRDAAGAAGTHRVDDADQLREACIASGLPDSGSGEGDGAGPSVAIEEFVEGHEGFLDTITINGHVSHEFASHYFPNVLEAMRTRWISPQIIATNRVLEPQYEEVREMAREVIAVLGLDTSATHMEWFFGPRGLKFSEIGARPPGVGQWDMYNEANEMDLHREWAHALMHGGPSSGPSRRYSCGLVALRPNRDGVISGYSGLDEVHRRYGDLVTAEHLPAPGTPTQPIEAGYHANAWLRLRHPDFDTLKDVLSDVGRLAQVWAD
jgi:formate-dependent phosphoribosylglycinamide formyltransferase (GAR transformylase)